MPQSFGSLPCHIVFSTKNRIGWINDVLAPQLYSYIGGILNNEKMKLLAAGGMPDHVHLLVSLSRVHSVAQVVNLVKANSSSWIHKTCPDLASFAWQSGYGAFAASRTDIEMIRGYIAKQKEHHSAESYQDEFRAILRAHDLYWDEKYVWD